MPPLLFGRRPPQSNYPPDTVQRPGNGASLGTLNKQGWYFNVASLHTGVQSSMAPTYATCRLKSQCQAIVKVHRVFPSFCGYTAFSPRLQFHRVSGRDSVEIVTPFVQVGTYPTRNFATLGPL